jgi:hypothetical protein
MGDTHMHCWKTINVKKQYGFDRLFFISALIGAAVFTSYYMLLAIVYAEPLSDQNFMLFMIGMLAIYPVHKLLHLVPLFGSRKCLKISIRKQLKLCPTISLYIKEPVRKSRFMLSLVLPFSAINTTIVVLSILWPAYSHYFAILLAYHSALCVTDLIYMRNLARSPRHALIEESDTGFEILVPQPMA